LVTEFGMTMEVRLVLKNALASMVVKLLGKEICVKAVHWAKVFALRTVKPAGSFTEARLAAEAKANGPMEATESNRS